MRERRPGRRTSERSEPIQGRARSGRIGRRREQARRRAVARRRRTAVAGLAGLSMIAGMVVGAGAGGDDSTGPQQAAEGPACPPEIAADPRRLAGQMLVVRMEDEATPELVRAARRGAIAGVIVFPVAISEPADLRPELRRLRRAAEAGGNPPLLVMIDQEGGGASRFPLEPPQRSPAQLAEFGAPRDARLEGQATGNFLARIGIEINLAPVLDVPAAEDSALAPRSFGMSPRRVTRLGVAFADGLVDEGVIAVPKHFPGLGRAEVSTDAAPVTIGAPARRLRGDLAPFREAISQGARMIMVSLASYPAYGSEGPAALSAAVVDRLLRGQLGFDGVVISDDLEAPAITATDLGEGDAAVAAAGAGVDLLLFALGGGTDARRELVRAIRRERLDRGAALRTCGRTTALRSQLSESP